MRQTYTGFHVVRWRSWPGALLLTLLPAAFACPGPKAPTTGLDTPECVEPRGDSPIPSCFIAWIRHGDASDSTFFEADFIQTPGAVTSIGVTAIDFPEGSGERRSILFVIHAPEFSAQPYELGQGPDHDPYFASASFVEGEGSDDPGNNVFNGVEDGIGAIELTYWGGPQNYQGRLVFTGRNSNGGTVMVAGAFNINNIN